VVNLDPSPPGGFLCCVYDYALPLHPSRDILTGQQIAGVLKSVWHKIISQTTKVLWVSGWLGGNGVLASVTSSCGEPSRPSPWASTHLRTLLSGRWGFKGGATVGTCLPVAVSAILRRHFLGAVMVPQMPFRCTQQTAQRPGHSISILSMNHTAYAP